MGRNGIGKCTLTKDMCGTTDVTSDGLTDKVEIKMSFTPDPKTLMVSFGADFKTSDLCDIHKNVKDRDAKVEDSVNCPAKNPAKPMGNEEGKKSAVVGLKAKQPLTIVV